MRTCPSCQRSNTRSFPLFRCLLLLTSIVLATNTWGASSLDVAVKVKENAGVGATFFPLTSVIPLPEGRFLDPAMLGMSDVPSQIEVLERWPGDQSLRHVLVHFPASVETNGKAVYRFTQGKPISPSSPVVVGENPFGVVVTTGPLKFTVKKNAFNILDEVWLDTNSDGVFQEAEKVIASHLQNGGVFMPRDVAGPVQYDTARQDLQVAVEEWGPVRAVIRVEAPARFTGTSDHLHGFSVRIYAFSGQPFVKIDYQLQNSDKNVVRSWPLYFEAMNLDFRLNLASTRRVRFGLGNGSVLQIEPGSVGRLAQEMHNQFRIYGSGDSIVYDSGKLANGVGPDGFMDVADARRGVMAVVRNFWQMWPNGLEIDQNNKLSVQLFPSWSAQWHGGAFSPSGLYWLEDMQHVYKEVFLYFHGSNTDDAALINLAQTFQFYPTAMVPTDWFRDTRATLDMGGIIPPAAAIPKSGDHRRPVYHAEGFDLQDWYDETGPYYGAGWVNFYDPEPGYRAGSCMHGGWPYSAAHTIATRNPADYFEAEAHGQSELNLRTEWMTDYRHEEDWELLHLTENPYCGGRWRIFDGHGISKLAAPPLPGTGGEEPVYYSRDDQHGWFYHVMEAYFLTGNPWIRDWYRFIAEFRRVRLDRLDPFPDTSSRATAHGLHQVLQAYRVTGDLNLLGRFRNHLLTYLKPDQDPFYGDQRKSVEESGGGFQTGYLMRTLITYLEEVRSQGDWQAYAEAFNYLSGLMEWNCNYGNFPYYFDARKGGKGVSSGTALTMVDPQAWYYWNTGKKKYLDQLERYMTTGINGGETPYGEFDKWRGQFEGRDYLYVTHTVRKDSIPPQAITDLRATMPKPSRLRIGWTAPDDAERYHVVWSDKPIVEEQSTDKSVTNWWAAQAVGVRLKPVAGKWRTLAMEAPENGNVYVAIFSFDRNGNMSTMSNVVRAR